jgi:hypothetical protein
MASGVLQDCSWAAKGCEARSFFVFFSYFFTASRKIVSKGVEEGVGGGSWAMAIVEGGRHRTEGL